MSAALEDGAMQRTVQSSILALLGVCAGCAGMRLLGAPSGPIGERQALMHAMADEAEDITQAFNIGSEGFDVAMIAGSAQQMAANAHQIPGLFPAGSTSPQSRALPAIWERWSAFVAL